MNGLSAANHARLEHYTEHTIQWITIYHAGNPPHCFPHFTRALWSRTPIFYTDPLAHYLLWTAGEYSCITITELHHHYLIIIRLLPEVTSSSCRIRVLIITLEIFFFSAKTVNIWNSLPNYVIDVQSIDVFKVRLDKFWAQQKVMFDWTADLPGTGDRSEYTVKSY